jgi:hypothetical protein
MHAANVLHRDVKVDQFVEVADGVVRSHRFFSINFHNFHFIWICMYAEHLAICR